VGRGGVRRSSLKSGGNQGVEGGTERSVAFLRNFLAHGAQRDAFTRYSICKRVVFPRTSTKRSYLCFLAHTPELAGEESLSKAALADFSLDGGSTQHRYIGLVWYSLAARSPNSLGRPTLKYSQICDIDF
jgi:hypothetical protein